MILVQIGAAKGAFGITAKSGKLNPVMGGGKNVEEQLKPGLIWSRGNIEHRRRLAM